MSIFRLLKKRSQDSFSYFKSLILVIAYPRSRLCTVVLLSSIKLQCNGKKFRQKYFFIQKIEFERNSIWWGKMHPCISVKQKILFVLAKKLILCLSDLFN